MEKCYDGEDICCIKINWIKKKILEIVISCFILIILLELMILKVISKLNLIHVFISFLFFFKYSHGMEFHDHGFFNLIGYFIIFIIMFVGLLILYVLFYFIKKNYLIFIEVFITIFILFLIFSPNPINCYDWSKGLNNTYIDNNISKYGCKINIPKKCPYKVGAYILDFTKIIGINCTNRKPKARENILKLSKSPYINESTLRIGFPLTNKDYICFLDNKDDIVIKEYFLKNLIDMDNLEKIYNKFLMNNFPEIIVDFSKNPYGEMIINLTYNNTLSKERKNKEKFSNPYSKNIMILFIDSVSRANSIRKLKNTLNFFEKFISYKGGSHNLFPSETFHSFQFFKYHSFLYHTRANFPRIFYGNKRESKNLILITKYLKESGYITSYSGDICQRDNTRTKHNLTIEEAYDHQMLLCDPNKPHFNLNHIKCLYGKIYTQFLYEYSNQFWHKYKNNRKFLLIVTNDGHEGTLESLKYVDNIIFNFLNNIFNENLLKDSSVFLLSDHGVGMPSFYYLYDFYKFEEQLPMLYLIINDRKNISYNHQYKNLYDNQQTFITAFDIYNTLGHLIYGDNYIFIKNKTEYNDTPKSSIGQSLFYKIDQKYRSPLLFNNMSNLACN